MADYAGVICNREKQDSENVFAAKIYGTKLLYETFENSELDFFVLCSSVASLYAPPAQVSYVAANMYLDSFAKNYSVQNKTIISIGWNHMTDVGMAKAAFEIHKKQGGADIADSISKEQGYHILKSAINSKVSNVFVSKDDLQNISYLKSELVLDINNEIENQELNEGSVDEAMTSQEQVKTRLLHVVQKFFGNVEIDEDDDFFEIGGDSLKAILFINRINKLYNKKIPVSKIFLYRSIREIATLVINSDFEKLDLIEKTKDNEYYVASSAQKRMYFLYEYDKKSLAYNMPQVLKLKGEIDIKHLEKVFIQLITRHETLRTSYHIIDGEIAQKISKPERFDIDYFEIDNENVQTKIKEFIQPFNLNIAPLLRVGLMKSSEFEHILIVDIHHIATDGTSQGLLIKDFMALYNKEELPELKVKYRDYSVWQQSESQLLNLEKKKEFWMSEFKEEVIRLEIPQDYPRPEERRYEGNTIKFELTREETSRLKSISKEHGATMFMTILALYNILLSKLSNQDDIVIGTPVNGRNHNDLEQIIGLFFNTIVLRNSTDNNLEFKSFLSNVKSKTISCFDNQEYQYENLIEELKLERDTNRNPLFDFMFIFQNYESHELNIPELTLNEYEAGHDISKFDLTLNAMEANEQVLLNFEYSTSLFKEETIALYINYFKKIVSQLVNAPSIKLSELEIVLSEEKEKILYDFNDTKRNYASDKTITQLFEEIVKNNSEKVALTFQNREITFQQLNEKSNQLARKIESYNNQKEEAIGVLLPRTEDLIIALLAVLKAGCAYVPIDPNYPIERIKYMAENSKLSKIITTESMHTIYSRLGADIEKIDVSSSEIYIGDTANLTSNLNSSNLAYLIYTSGSTGNPKGIGIEHKSIVNLIYGISESVKFSNNHTFLCLTTISFDIFVLEVFFPLLTGRKIVLANESEQKDINQLASLIHEHKVDIMQITPSHLKVLMSNVNMFDSVNVLLVGGEPFPEGLLKDLKKLYKGQIYNMYGPTETTVWSTVQNVSETGTTNIGKPIANTIIRIVDKNKKLVPIGISGELCIGGEGLARGYWNNNMLTEQKFISDTENKKNKLYCTGDLAKWLPDGDIKYIGREDNQVKIRGFRIELGDIESHLLSFTSIKEALVIAKELEADKYLVAYYITDVDVNITELSKFLVDKLPDYMVPSYFVKLERMPLTPNGKINRKDLPNPEIQFDNGFMEPSTKTEDTMVKIWSKLLKMDKNKISTNANFFEIGGHSLKATLLANKIQKEFNIEIPLFEVFKLNTIKAISEYIENMQWMDNEGQVESPKDNLYTID